ncbi:hypothetical protein DRW07_04755 [Alteromonas sediminis]|uniref:Uncharacterized protein n=1 Tax=Alteromonas sediminis TaxID=2259342 RepID=A0A3N5ZEC2_9ALTE|nr:hypothetical protein [Alteromonas sediminis]RPJ68708.1 hypothetical protein DRW07_04755 [Alteromonas sediminis]
MTVALPLYKKLILLYRIEPGCLGPEGGEHVEAFCDFARKKLKDKHKHFMRWTIKPRYDKGLPELEFQIKNAPISREQAAKFMVAFDVNINAFEEQLEEELAQLVDDFFER